MKMFMDVVLVYLTILSLNYFALKWNFKLEKKVPKDAFLFVGIGMWIPAINVMTLLVVITVNLASLASFLIDKCKNKAKKQIISANLVQCRSGR